MAAIDEGKQGSESGGEKGEGPADSGGEVAIAVSGKKVYLENKGEKTILKDLGWKHFK